MKDTIELLDSIISSETKSIEKMLHLNKEDKLTILRLQNKLKALEKNIEEHKKLTEKYRSYLSNMSKATHIGSKSNLIGKGHLDTAPSITKIELVGKELEK